MIQKGAATSGQPKKRISNEMTVFLWLGAVIFVCKTGKPELQRLSVQSSLYVTIDITSLPGSAGRLPFVQRLTTPHHGKRRKATAFFTSFAPSSAIQTKKRTFQDKAPCGAGKCGMVAMAKWTHTKPGAPPGPQGGPAGNALPKGRAVRRRRRKTEEESE